VVAHIHPEHIASGKVAAALGMHRTDEVDSEGELVWVLEADQVAPR
jgi:RimJ/RimL family protein N-acetyltransferase